MAQGLGHIKLSDQKILVLVRQGKTTWSYKLRKSGKEGFEVMDSDYLASDEGKEYLNKIMNGQSVTL
ncbi:MAG: hypothetical protein ABIC04_02435 [Nanoarchaeota archaeon]